MSEEPDNELLAVKHLLDLMESRAALNQNTLKRHEHLLYVLDVRLKELQRRVVDLEVALEGDECEEDGKEH